MGSGAASLVSKGVDCINNFTDNNVVNNLSTLYMQLIRPISLYSVRKSSRLETAALLLKALIT